MNNSPNLPMTQPPHSNGSFWNAFTFDITQEEDEQARFRFQPQVQDGWRSYNLFSFRTDKHREFLYWLRQALAINPSLLGLTQLAGMVFFGALPKWLIYSLYLAKGFSVYTILLAIWFFLIYGMLCLLGLKTRELTIPTAIRISIATVGAVML